MWIIYNPYYWIIYIFFDFCGSISDNIAGYVELILLALKFRWNNQKNYRCVYKIQFFSFWHPMLELMGKSSQIYKRGIVCSLDNTSFI